MRQVLDELARGDLGSSSVKELMGDYEQWCTVTPLVSVTVIKREFRSLWEMKKASRRKKLPGFGLFRELIRGILQESFLQSRETQESWLIFKSSLLRDPRVVHHDLQRSQ